MKRTTLDKFLEAAKLSDMEMRVFDLAGIIE